MLTSTAPDRQSGFTMIELMIVVAIIGILAAIAIPNYFDSVRRSRIIDATTTLGDLRSQLEKYYMDNRQYLNGAACAAYVAIAAHNASPSTKFNIAATTCTANTYVLTATRSGPMAGFVYTIDQQNNKATVSTSWGATSPNCWVSNKGGLCL